MSTLAAPEVKAFGAETVERKAYDIVEALSQYIPIPNDRNRLGFCLYKYMTGQGDAPEVLVKTAKIKITGIPAAELAKKISASIESAKK